MAKPTLLALLLGLLALTTLLSFIEARPQPIDDEELGTILGPHHYGPEEEEEDVGGQTLDDDDLGIVIGPHELVDVPMTVSREDFPEDFIFGTSVSAYQVEGAKRGNGRGMTTWDEFTHMFAEKVKNQSDGDFGTDFINRYKDDVKLMRELRTNGFRFSISWTRVLPYGRVRDGVNEEGVKFYNDLIDELVNNDIQPAVTLFHWESPLALEMEYKGFLDKRIVEDFRDFARFCFEKFGDRVKNWATFNEPSVYSIAGYSKGKKAPGRCSKYENDLCLSGDSSIEPYIVSHYQILAHVAAVEEFRKCEQCKKGGPGEIGIVFVCHWFEPKDPNSKEDKNAAARSLEFQLGWFLYPLTYGDYPTIMKETVGERLPKFTKEESQRITDNSLDFVGLNYYGAFYATHNDKADLTLASYASDLRTNWTTDHEEGHAPRKATSMGILIHPHGMREVLNYIKNNYNDPDIYIMENGLDEIDDGQKSLEEAVNDYGRKEFIKSHILVLGKAIKLDNVKVKGYFIWSLMDNFEWDRGYRVRFGVYYVDYKNDMKRYMRESGKWLREFLRDDASLSVCYFESHRQKGEVPKLFNIEHLDPLDKSLSYVSDVM